MNTSLSSAVVQPILVVGMNRSGTTWLTNILCNHPQIAGVQSPDHYGIIETNMFGHFQEMFGDLRFEENYRGLIELWSRTDFFRTAGANRRQLHQWSPHPTSYMEIFQSVLDDFARRQQCPYWVQKVSPLRLHYLEELPRRARLVVILRQPVPTIRSAAQLIQNGNRHIWTGKIAFGYALQRKLLKRLIRTTRPCVVHYEALLEDAGGTVGRICEHLQLPFDASLLEQRYERNTSFGSKQPTSKLTTVDWLSIQTGLSLAALLPTPLLLRLRRNLGTKGKRLVSGSLRQATARSDDVPASGGER